MLLPTMNQTEIILQVKRDFEKIVDTTLVRLVSEYDRERRKLKIQKQRTYSKVYTIKTGAKNNWIIVLGKSPSVETYKNPGDGIAWNAATYFYDAKGLKVLKWTDPYLNVYSAHFFQRYNQRLKLNLNNPYDVIKHYLIHNMHNGYHCEINNRKPYFIGFSKEGLQLGTLEQGNLMLWRTFVSADLIRSDQHEMKQQVIRTLYAQWMKAVIENKPDTSTARFTWNQLNMLNGKYDPQ